jgi:two-component system chemotaxis response regulator CheY
MFNLADKSILLVDDSPIMRLILVMNLKRLFGARVTEAMKGQDALTKLEHSRYDLVLTDMVKSEMDDAELIQYVRTRLKSDIPNIVIATKGEIQDQDRGISLGANGYLTKPLNMVELVRAVLTFFENQGI